MTIELSTALGGRRRLLAESHANRSDGDDEQESRDPHGADDTHVAKGYSQTQQRIGGERFAVIPACRSTRRCAQSL